MKELRGFRELAESCCAGNHRRDGLGIRTAGAEFDLEPRFLEIPVLDRDDVANLPVRNQPVVFDSDLRRGTGSTRNR